MLNIESARISMTQLTKDDWALFQRLHQDEKVIRYAFDKPEVEDIRRRFESRLPVWQWGSKHWLCLVIREQWSGKAIGVTGLCVSEEGEADVEIGYMLLPESHGLGYGTESLVALVRHVEQNFPVEKISAIVTDGNIASRKVLEKCGFKLFEREKNAYQIGGVLYDDLIYRYLVKTSEPA